MGLAYAIKPVMKWEACRLQANPATGGAPWNIGYCSSRSWHRKGRLLEPEAS